MNLILHDFHPIISLDGNCIEHDKHRIFPNGNGSFDVVMRNLNTYYEKSGQPIFVNAVFSIDTNLENVIQFFSSNSQFMCINISPVSPVNTSYYDKYTVEQFNQFNESFASLRNQYYSIIKEGRTKTISNEQEKRVYILDLLFTKSCMAYIMRRLFGAQPEGIKYTSACVPTERIFVDVDGYIYPCEKISRTRNLGHIRNGLDIQKIVDYMNSYVKEILPKCQNCEINSVCTACYNAFMTNGQFYRPDEFCVQQIEQTKQNLAHYCYINELNDEWLEKFRINYYKKLNEIVVTLK